MPYLVFLFTCGIPLFLLETAIGQYTQQGSITSWRKLCPLAEGRHSDPEHFLSFVGGTRGNHTKLKLEKLQNVNDGSLASTSPLCSDLLLQGKHLPKQSMASVSHKAMFKRELEKNAEENEEGEGEEDKQVIDDQDL